MTTTKARDRAPTDGILTMKRTIGFLLIIVCCLLVAFLVKRASEDALTTVPVPAEPPANSNVTTHTWETASNIYSHLWFRDGKYKEGGTVHAGFRQLTMKVTRHPNSIDYELRMSPASAIAGVIQWDPSNVPEMTFTDDGVLPINGRTRIFTCRERAPDGETV